VPVTASHESTSVKDIPDGRGTEDAGTAWMNETGANGSSFPSPSKSNWSQRSGPGILVFSHNLQLLHMNQRALDLIGQATNGPGTMVLSRAVAEFRTHIQSRLGHSHQADATGLLEAKRVMVESGRTISVRGIGVPALDSGHHPRIVIILEEISQPDGRRMERTVIQELCDRTTARHIEEEALG
jgi:hypothetical protein